MNESLLNLLVAVPYAAIGYACVRRWAPAPAMLRRLLGVAAALGATAGLLVYVVRVISRLEFERDVYPIGATGTSGIFLALLVGWSHGPLRGLGTFLTFVVATVAAASIALGVVVNNDIAGFGS